MAGGAFHRLQHRGFNLPITQNEGLGVGESADVADAKEVFRAVFLFFVFHGYLFAAGKFKSSRRPHYRMPNLSAVNQRRAGGALFYRSWRWARSRWPRSLTRWTKRMGVP